MTTRKNQNGSVLLASVIITVLILAIVVQYCNWVNQSTRANVHHLARQKALVNADTGVQAALQFLRTPQASNIKQDGTPLHLTSVEEGTTFYLTLTRVVVNPSLIDVDSQGYYLMATGSDQNALGQRGQTADIHAQIMLRSVGDYFAASPGTLEIGYGSNIGSGIIYARDLVFDTGTSNPKTIIKAASYFNSVSPANFANYVTFQTPNQPTQVTVEADLPTLDIGMRNQYQGMTNSPSDILPGGTVLSGTLAPPSNKVYFSPGNVTLGAPGADSTLTSSFLIYSEGDIYIANNLNGQLNGTAWPVLMAEGNIYISSAAPDNLTLSATMITNGQLKALGSAETNGVLNMTGGIVAGGGVVLGNIYTKQRNYTFQAPDPTEPLPFTAQVMGYKVISGKFNQ